MEIFLVGFGKSFLIFFGVGFISHALWKKWKDRGESAQNVDEHEEQAMLDELEEYK